MSDNHRLSVVYNSDLAIEDKSLLSTLAIFYDHIFLPAETARQTVAIILNKGFPQQILIYIHRTQMIITSGRLRG